MERKRIRPVDSLSQFVELLSVGGGAAPIGYVPKHLSNSEDGKEPLVVLTVRNKASLVAYNISLTKEQGRRLMGDLKAAFKNDPTLSQ